MVILYKTQYDKDFQEVEQIYYSISETPYINEQLFFPAKYNYRVVFLPERKQLIIESDIDNIINYKFIDIDKIRIEK